METVGSPYFLLSERATSDSGVYAVAPLARLNAADGMPTPLAQEAYERFYETLGGKPVHHTLATHWARLIEMLSAAEMMLDLAQDPEFDRLIHSFVQAFR